MCDQFPSTLKQNKRSAVEMFKQYCPKCIWKNCAVLNTNNFQEEQTFWKQK